MQTEIFAQREQTKGIAHSGVDGFCEDWQVDGTSHKAFCMTHKSDQPTWLRFTKAKIAIHGWWRNLLLTQTDMTPRSTPCDPFDWTRAKLGQAECGLALNSWWACPFLYPLRRQKYDLCACAIPNLV